MIHFHNIWYLLLTYLSHCRLPSSEKVPGISFRDALIFFLYSLDTLKVYKSPQKNELHTIQAAMCHISRNKSYLWALKKSQGRPYETSCNIFCNSFKLVGVFKSPKNVELYTIQGIICHLGAISRSKSDCQVLTSLKDVLMRRPATYFATVLNWLGSSNLPKTLNYIQ